MMIDEELNILAMHHDFVQRTKDNFWIMFKVYKTEYNDEYLRYFPNFQRSLLDFIVDNISIRLINWPLNTSLFAVRLNLHYADEPIGFYICYYALDGTFNDDIFDLY